MQASKSDAESGGNDEEQESMTCGDWIESYVPARLDRLPWTRLHWLIVIALGATWILDGLEVTLAGSVGAILTHRDTLHLSDTQVGASATFYLIGAVVGAIVFRLCDRSAWAQTTLFHHRRPFISWRRPLTASSWNFASYAFFRMLDRRGHRRRIRRDQFRDRRTDPGAGARARRSHDQRLLLDRRGAGSGRAPFFCSIRAFSRCR